MWGTSKYLSESLKRIKRGQNVGNTLQDYVNWYLNSECWSLLLLVQIPSSWLGSQPEAMTSAFETWKCEAWCPYLTAAHARNPRIHKIGNAWSWISWGILGGCYLFSCGACWGQGDPRSCYMWPDQMHVCFRLQLPEVEDLYETMWFWLRDFWFNEKTGTGLSKCLNQSRFLT
jgi:hypothetical protein